MVLLISLEWCSGAVSPLFDAFFSRSIWRGGWGGLVDAVVAGGHEHRRDCKNRCRRAFLELSQRLFEREVPPIGGTEVTPVTWDLNDEDLELA